MDQSQRVQQALIERIKGEVRFDCTSRVLYSTDASNYQFMPIGVVLPKDAEDVLAAIQIAAEERVPITPRGAGTSLAGQTVGNGIIIDFSKYMNGIVEIDPERKIARVEPGVRLIQLNNALKPYKLVLGPDPATQNRCNLGGMIANNTSGSHSLVYGKTADHTRALKCILSNGEVVDFGPNDSSPMAKQIKSLLEPHREEILARYPKIPRRVSGYNFDTALTSDTFSLADLVVGSEGTLATITEAALTLSDLKTKKGLALLAFPDRFSACDSVPILLKTNTQVLEMIDHRLLEMARQSAEHRHKLEMVGDAQAVLILEFAADELEPIERELEDLKSFAKDLPGKPTCLTFTDEETQENVWQVREAGLGLLARRVGEIKSVEFVEDTAIPPERLGDYIRRFEQIVAKHGTSSAIYGHAGQGCLHIRLDMTLRTAEGVKMMRDIADEVTDLVIEFGGVYSGEHGDGISRSEFLPKLYGKTIMDLHREVKSVFDPAGIMNPGKIVDPLPMDENLRFGPDYRSSCLKTTYFDFSDQESYNMAVEACNGEGTCRKIDIGTMCPSYMATMEEMHSPRARANMLREAMKGNFDGFSSADVAGVLELCIECKGCKRECPVGVDMTRYKAEYMAQYYDIHDIPARVRAFGCIDRLAALGSRMPGIANWMSSGPFSGLVKQIAGVHPARHLPVFAEESFRSWFTRRSNRPPSVPPSEGGKHCSLVGRESLPSISPSQEVKITPLLTKEGQTNSPLLTKEGQGEVVGRVILLDDAFNGFFKPETLKAAVEVLERAGFEVSIPPVPVSCGRAFLSKSMLKQARKSLQHLVDILAPLIDCALIVGLEPSEVLSLRDELPALLSDPRASAIAAKSFTFEELLCQFATDFEPGRLEGHALVHGHCHQKAITGIEPLKDVLDRVEGLTYTILDSGCCGMAGSFGYEKEHYEISKAIGERVLLPAVRALPPEDFVVADGFSCRTQITDFCNGRKALHLAELLALCNHG